MKRAALLWLGAMLALWAQAADEPTRWAVEAGTAREHLSNGSPAWRQTDLTLRARWAPRSEAEAGLRRVQRYGQTDHEAALGLALPLDAQWGAALRASAVDGPTFLPRLGGAAELSRQLPGGWVVSAGLGRHLYASAGSPSAGTSTLRLGWERYVGDWRLAGGWARARLDGGPRADGLRLQADRYFGELGRIGLLLASGDELENAPGSVLSTRVDALALTARWPLAAGWALSAELGSTRIGQITRRTGDPALPTGPGYRRSGVRLGVQHTF